MRGPEIAAAKQQAAHAFCETMLDPNQGDRNFLFVARHALIWEARACEVAGCYRYNKKAPELTGALLIEILGLVTAARNAG